MVIPILMHLELLLQSRLKFERCKPNKAAWHPTKLMTSSNYFQNVLVQFFDVIQYNIASALQFLFSSNMKTLGYGWISKGR